MNHSNYKSDLITFSPRLEGPQAHHLRHFQDCRWLFLCPHVFLMPGPEPVSQLSAQLVDGQQWIVRLILLVLWYLCFQIAVRNGILPLWKHTKGQKVGRHESWIILSALGWWVRITHRLCQSAMPFCWENPSKTQNKIKPLIMCMSILILENWQNSIWLIQLELYTFLIAGVKTLLREFCISR